MFLERLKRYPSQPEIFRNYIKQTTEITASEVDEVDEASNLGALVYAAFVLNAKDYQAMMERLDNRLLEALLLEEKAGYEFALAFMISYADTEVSQILLKRLSPEVFNKLAYKVGAEPLLHLAAKNLDSEGFQKILNQTASRVLKQVLFIQNDRRETLLHLAARYQGAEGFEALSDRLNSDMPEAFKRALLLQDKEGWSAFACIMLHQDNSAFEKSILRLGVEVNAALQLKTSDKRNRRPSGTPEVHKAKFKAWAGKNSRQSCYSANGLHLAARFLASQSFKVLLSSVSREALSKTLTKRDSNGRTPLQIADQYQDRDAVGLLLMLADPSAVETARVSDTFAGYCWTKIESKGRFVSMVADVRTESRKLADAPEFDMMPFLRAASRQMLCRLDYSRVLPARPE